jgi:hypothetical protein
VIAAIQAAAPDARDSITYDDSQLPFPDEVDASSLAELVDFSSDTPLADGVAATIARFRQLLADGRLTPVTAGEPPTAAGIPDGGGISS